MKRGINRGNVFVDSETFRENRAAKIKGKAGSASLLTSKGLLKLYQCLRCGAGLGNCFDPLGPRSTTWATTPVVSRTQNLQFRFEHSSILLTRLTCTADELWKRVACPGAMRWRLCIKHDRSYRCSFQKLGLGLYPWRGVMSLQCLGEVSRGWK